MNIREFTLTDEHATAVSDEILGAVRDGGGYVHLSPITGPGTDVLITPATTVVFERITAMQPSAAHPAEAWMSDTWPDDFA